MTKMMLITEDTVKLALEALTKNSDRVTEIRAKEQAITALREALADQQAQPHPDDVAVDLFAEAMKAKMAKQRAKGYGGWDDPAVCPTERLQQMLVDHIAKGDPVDVANFAMMLWSRGERTEQPAPVREDWGPGPHEYHSLPAQHAVSVCSTHDSVCDDPFAEIYGEVKKGTEVYTVPSPQRQPLPDGIPSPDELEALSDGNDGMLLNEDFPDKLDRLARWLREYAAAPAQQERVEPDYAWPTVADYEKDVGFEVNQTFKMAWDMARTTNSFLNQLAGVTPQPAQQEREKCSRNSD